MVTCTSFASTVSGIIVIWVKSTNDQAAAHLQGGTFAGGSENGNCLKEETATTPDEMVLDGKTLPPRSPLTDKPGVVNRPTWTPPKLN
jgi:hypothetical protein